MNSEFIQADARSIPLPDESVQCEVTSPPYWGLRKYSGDQELVWGGQEGCRHEWATERYYTEQTAAGSSAEAFSEPGEANKKGLKDGRWRESNTCLKCGAWRGGFGLEPIADCGAWTRKPIVLCSSCYICHTLLVLREQWRVLRKDGVVFWNLGDSYAGGGGFSPGAPSNQPEQAAARGQYRPNYNAARIKPVSNKPIPGLKPKDLCLIPFRVALAAQADGWWVRSDIIWSKPNPMPQSVTDRPTDAYEHILMLTKSARYFWDAAAVREPSRDLTGVERYRDTNSGISADDATLRQDDGGKVRSWENVHRDYAIAGNRNLRNVWEFPTQPYKGAHFATFPEELPRRCIKAATSEKGYCPKCGAPWVRVVERAEPVKAADFGGKHGAADPQSAGHRIMGNTQARRNGGAEHDIPFIGVKTIGWRAGCECEVDSRLRGNDTRPCLVLDPFGGSGTTAKVAIELGRRAVSLDLAYHDLAKKRTRELQRPLVMV